MEILRKKSFLLNLQAVNDAESLELSEEEAITEIEVRDHCPEGCGSEDPKDAKAIDLQQFEKLSGTDRLYSIRHPESRGIPRLEMQKQLLKWVFDFRSVCAKEIQI